MNANTMDNNTSSGTLLSRFLKRADRTFCWYGYTRAAGELRRLGYTEEANRLLEERAKL